MGNEPGLFLPRKPPQQLGSVKTGLSAPSSVSFCSRLRWNAWIVISVPPLVAAVTGDTGQHRGNGYFDVFGIRFGSGEPLQPQAGSGDQPGEGLE